MLTFGAVSLSVEGIANRGEATAAIQLRGQGDLMNAGTMKVLMTIPITPPDFSLHYSGSLSAMDLTRLDAFLDIAEHTRIKSGSAQEAAFEIDVTAGQARGHVRAIYKDLEIAVLDKQTGTEKGLDNRVASFLANVLKIRNVQRSGRIGLDEGGGGKLHEKTGRRVSAICVVRPADRCPGCHQPLINDLCNTSNNISRAAIPSATW